MKVKENKKLALVQVWLPDQLKKKFQIECVKKNVSMKDVIISAIENYVKGEQG